MGKYDPLTQHLATCRAARVPMTFAQLEELLGFSLPPSSRKHRGWWSNNPDNNVMTKAWVCAGYKTADVDIENGKLVFQKQDFNTLNAAGFAEVPAEFEAKPLRHPLFGALKGLITLQEGYDYTLPADPHWSDVYK